MLSLLMVAPAYGWEIATGIAVTPDNATLGTADNVRVLFTDDTTGLSRTFSTVPLIFTLPDNAGNGPAAVRVTDVTVDGFTLVPVEPPGTQFNIFSGIGGVEPGANDGPHEALQVHWIAVEAGQHKLPDGTKLEAGFIDTTTVVSSSDASSWESISYQHSYSAVPGLLVNIQTMANEAGGPPGDVSNPSITAVSRNLSTAGAEIALERSQVITGDAIAQPERLAYLAMEVGSGSFQPSDGTTEIQYQVLGPDPAEGIRGDTLCDTRQLEQLTLAVLVGAKNSRNDSDGGWLRRCSLTPGADGVANTVIGLAVEEDQEIDNERTHLDREDTTVVGFGRPFVATFGLIADYYLDDCDMEEAGATIVDEGRYMLDGEASAGVIREDLRDLVAPAPQCYGARLSDGAHIKLPEDPYTDIQGQISLAAWVNHDGNTDDVYQNIIGKGDNAYRMRIERVCVITDAGPPSTATVPVDAVDPTDSICANPPVPGAAQGEYQHVLNFAFNFGPLPENSFEVRSGTEDGGFFYPQEVPANVWQHVAATYDGLSLKIYIDGIQVASTAVGGSVVPINANDARPSIGVTLDEGGTVVSDIFNGVIDEVAIWNIAIPASNTEDASDPDTVNFHRTRTRECESCRLHFLIDHDGEGINCLPEPITITVLDQGEIQQLDYEGLISLSTSTSHGDWSIESANGTLVAGAPDSGMASYQFDLADEGQITLRLRDTFPETVNIDIVDEDDFTEYRGEPGEEDVHRDSANDAIEHDPDLSYDPSGFVFLGDGVASNIGAQIAAKPSDVEPEAQVLQLQAINTDTNTGDCEAALVGPSDIELAFECVDSPSCIAGRDVLINGQAIAANNSGSVANYSAVPLDFGSDTNDSASFVLQYPDVGQLRLHARYNLPLEDGSPSVNFIEGSSNNFVVRPFGWHLSIAGNPAAQDSSGDVFRQAGENFDIQIRAVAWQATDDANADGRPDGHEDDDFDLNNNSNLADNPTVLNFGNELAESEYTVELGARLHAPIGGNDPGLQGDITVSSFVNGVATTTVNYPEVGIIEIFAHHADGGALSDYLGIGSDQTSRILGRSSAVGRFVPAYLEASVLLNGAFAESCGPGGFTYTGEPFSYQQAPEIRFTAKNVQGGTTENYRGNFAKLVESDPLISASGLDSEQTGANGTATAYSRTESARTLNDNQNGTLDLVLGVDQFNYTRDSNALIAPYITAVVLNLDEATDSDGVESQTLPLEIEPAGVDLRFGRLVVGNAYGPEQQPLQPRFETEFFDGRNWQRNSDDSCTVVTEADLQVENTDGLATSGGIGNQPFVDGNGDLNFTAPNQPGSIFVEPDLGSGAAARPWLQFDWDGSGSFDQNPRGRLTWGIFREQDGTVYRREVYFR